MSDINDTPAIIPAKIQHWISENFDSQKISDELMAIGFESEVINAYLSEFKRKKIQLRQSKAFIFLAIGTLLGFISCVLTILNPIPSIYFLILYGMTSVCVIIIFMGLYYLFE